MKSNRQLKCSCPACGCVWRMSRMWIDRAGKGLACPSCKSLAVEGDAPVTPEQRETMAKVVRGVATEAARQINEEELESRRAEIERRRRGSRS